MKFLNNVELDKACPWRVQPMSGAKSGSIVADVTAAAANGGEVSFTRRQGTVDSHITSRPPIVRAVALAFLTFICSCNTVNKTISTGNSVTLSTLISDQK